VVCLHRSGFYHSVYYVHFIEHSSVHKYSFWDSYEPTSVLYFHEIKQTSMGQTVAEIEICEGRS